jgi:hypothetical protein
LDRGTFRAHHSHNTALDTVGYDDFWSMKVKKSVFFH